MDKELFEYDMPIGFRGTLGMLFPKHNNKTYHNKKELYTYPILEKFGIIEYQDKRYEEMIISAAKRVKERLKSNNTSYDYYVPFDGDFYCAIEKVRPENSVSWIRELDIYFCKLNNKYEFDCGVLGDLNNNGEIICECHPIYKNNDIVPLVIKDGVIERGSIIIMTGDIDSFDFYGAISHELKHLYDINVRNINFYDLNRDIILADAEKNNNDVCFETNYLNYSDEQAKQFISSLNAKELYCLLIDNMYVLNKSEMSARLNQVYSRLYMQKKVDIMEILKYPHDYFMSISEYRYYNKLYIFFDAIEKYANKSEIEKMNNVYGNKIAEILSLDKNGKMTFSHYIYMMKTRMKSFFNKCDSILVDRANRFNL